jgi:group II intron reverse transcriptase/maturase
MGDMKPDSKLGGSHKLSNVRESELKLTRIAIKARSNPKERFSNLMHHLTPELIRQHLSKMPTRSASGVDGMTVVQALENLDWILSPQLKMIHEGSYKAPAVRRVYIPKSNGSERPIGIPAVLDRAIQAGMSSILSGIYEQDFLTCSFGFRQNRGCHHALATISELLRSHGMKYALEVDIRDFFGSLDHKWLRKFLNLRISDKRVLKLIDAWLAAGVIEDGKWRQSETGTPQGGSISPILSNIYLHYVLDLWFERKLKVRLKGNARLVRYCDDFVILFRNREDMEYLKPLLTARLAQFGLAVAEEKTHMTNLSPRARSGPRDRRCMSFLGFSIFRAKNRNGTGYKTVFKTEKKRFARAKESIKEKLQASMHVEIGSQVKMINSMLVGHFNYYGIAGNMKSIQRFWHLTIRLWRRSLSRRSQNGNVKWEKIDQLIEKHRLIPPRIRISYQQLLSYVRL